MEPLNQSSGQMNESQLRAILDPIYAGISHNHDSVYAAIGHNHDSVYAAIGHNHDSVYAAISHTHPYLPLTGGTLTGSLAFPGNGQLDTPGSSVARFFGGGAGGIHIQANFGPLALRCAGSPCLTISNLTNQVVIENPLTPDVNSTLRVNFRSTQLAPLFQLDTGGLTSGDAMIVGNGASTPVARITKTGQGQFTGVDITGGFFRPPPLTFGALPSASANSGAAYRLTDRGQKTVYSDGTNWLWIHDNSTAS